MGLYIWVTWLLEVVTSCSTCSGHCYLLRQSGSCCLLYWRGTPAKVTVRELKSVINTEYDKTAKNSKLKLGDWVLVDLLSSRWDRKLSQPWHGPYRVISRRDPNIVGTTFQMIQISKFTNHESNIVQHLFLLRYRNKRAKPGRPPKHVLKHFATTEAEIARSTGSKSGEVLTDTHH